MIIKIGSEVSVCTLNGEHAVGIVKKSTTVGVEIQLSDEWECESGYCEERGERVLIPWSQVRYVRLAE